MLKVKKNNQYKKAFTLAEVLITLGIIGVVAALTIPTLIQKADERATVSALKKAYAMLSSAYKLAEQEYGAPNTWGITANPSPQLLNPLKPYLKIDKDCSDGSAGCFPTGISYKYLHEAFGGEIIDNTYTKLRLTDGTLIAGVTDSTSCAAQYGTTPALKSICARYWVDTNGYKGPNQFGKDFFNFYLTKYGIIAGGTKEENTGIFTFDGACRDKDNSYGVGCTAWVIYNENMDYLKCNDLAWGTKTKCN